MVVVLAGQPRFLQVAWIDVACGRMWSDEWHVFLLHSSIDHATWASVTQGLISQAMEPVTAALRKAKVTLDRL